MNNQDKAARIKFMMDQIEAFKDFVKDSMDQEIDCDFDDHNVFLSAALYTFIEMNDEEHESDDETQMNLLK